MIPMLPDPQPKDIPENILAKTLDQLARAEEAKTPEEKLKILTEKI